MERLASIRVCKCILLCFLTHYQCFAVVIQCSGKEVEVTSFGQFQFTAQFGYGSGEVADGKVGAGDRGLESLYLSLGKTLTTENVEATAGEVGYQRVRGVEMAAGMQFCYLVVLRQAAKGTCLQQGGMGFVEILSGNIGIGAGCFSLRASGEAEGEGAAADEGEVVG